MQNAPEPEQQYIGELVDHVARERDAAWAAKLAILRVRRLEDIAFLGACLREHERHAEEIAQLARAAGANGAIPREACFVTRDPHIVGAIADADAVIDTMRGLEHARIERYEQQRRSTDGEMRRTLDALLERHLLDARARLRALEALRSAPQAIISHGAAA
jgi:hypothetical protein